MRLLAVGGGGGFRGRTGKGGNLSRFFVIEIGFGFGFGGCGGDGDMLGNIRDMDGMLVQYVVYSRGDPVR